MDYSSKEGAKQINDWHSESRQLPYRHFLLRDNGIGRDAFRSDPKKIRSETKFYVLPSSEKNRLENFSRGLTKILMMLDYDLIDEKQT